MVRILVIAASPSVETAGAASLLTSLDGCFVLHLTDGIPRDRSLWPEAAPRTVDEYRERRQVEVVSAMEIASISPAEILQLGHGALELSERLAELAHEVAHLVVALQPELIVTHAYEGGHPDNDSAAFAVAAARELLERTGQHPPGTLEMALYHGANGHRVVGQFAASDSASTPQIQCAFEGISLARKHAMLRCFETLGAALRPFYGLAHERFRPAPRYDFEVAPHFGELLYERQRLPTSGETWRAQATLARRALSLAGAAGASPMPS